MQEHLSIANIEMLLEASRIIHHTEFVIIGSLSVMGALREPPRAKVMSIDVGFYLKRDPGRAFDLMLLLARAASSITSTAITPMPFLPFFPHCLRIGRSH